MAKLRESMRSRVMYNRDLQKKALEDIQKITGWPDYLYRYLTIVIQTEVYVHNSWILHSQAGFL